MEVSTYFAFMVKNALFVSYYFFVIELNTFSCSAHLNVFLFLVKRVDSKLTFNRGAVRRC